MSYKVFRFITFFNITKVVQCITSDGVVDCIYFTWTYTRMKNSGQILCFSMKLPEG
jgi:hypothetical protein